jgi:hypothetical protein
LPGNPGTIAVSRMYRGFSPRHAGVGIYADGNLLPNLDFQRSDRA